MGIEKTITPRVKQLGDFTVRRALPSANCRTVGPFVFFDHMGPVRFGKGKGIDVRPHPHVCLSTLTYLFEGEIVHQDSLGCKQTIRPGEVNWMTAGRGIVHSERTSDANRASGQLLHGIQTWIALPKPHEETEPAFYHYDADATPVIRHRRVEMRVVAGQAFNKRSPVKTFSDLVCIDINMMARSDAKIDPPAKELAVYVADGDVVVEGQFLETGTLVTLSGDKLFELSTDGGARLVLFGGEPLDGERHLWWNFVASSRARIEKAKADWQEGRFDGIDEDEEFIPLPK